MLQSVKVGPSSGAPAPPQVRSEGPSLGEGLDPGFAGLLAQWVGGMALPAPAATVAPPEPSVRVESGIPEAPAAAERWSPRTTAPERGTERAAPKGEPEGAPRDTAPKEAAPTDKPTAEPMEGEAAPPVTRAGTPHTKVQTQTAEVGVQVTRDAMAVLVEEAPGAQAQQVPQSIASKASEGPRLVHRVEGQFLASAAPTTPGEKAPALTPSEPKSGQAAPTQPPAAGPAAMPLRELMARPLPALDTPLPVRQSQESPRPPGRDRDLAQHPEAVAANAQATPTRPAASEIPATLAASQVREARAAILFAKTEPKVLNPGSGVPLAVGGGVALNRLAEAKALTAAPAQTLRSSAVFQQVEGSIKWILKHQEQGAELQLHPEALGKVIIRLKMEGSQVHAQLWASDAASVPVLTSHRAFLEASLAEQGLSLGSFELQSGHRGQHSQEGPTDRPTRKLVAVPTGAGSLQEMPVSTTPTLLSAYRIEVYA